MQIFVPKKCSSKSKAISIALLLIVTISTFFIGVSPTFGSTSPSNFKAIDYSIWRLQGPTSNVEIRTSKQLSNGEYFDFWYKDTTTDFDAFMSPSTGYATSGASHCRTELRELLPDSTTTADWNPAGYHVMTVTYYIKQIGAQSATTGAGSVVIGQVWGASSSGNGMCELAYKPKTSGHAGSFAVKEPEGTWRYIDDVSIPLETLFTVKFEVIQSTLKIYVNEALKYTKALSGASFYFKCGNYDQSAGTIKSGSVSTKPYSIVEIASIEVLHNPISGRLTYNNGEAIANQTVSYTLRGSPLSSSRNLEKTAKTDENGYYLVENVPNTGGSYGVSNTSSVVITAPIITDCTLNGSSSWNIASAAVSSITGVRTGYNFVYTKPVQKVKYTITYNTAGCTGAPPADAPSEFYENEYVVIPSKGTLAKAGYSFSVWSDQNGMVYYPLTSVYLKGNTELTPVWIPDPQWFTVKFDGNGGTGNPPGDISFTGGGQVTIPGQNGLSKTGHKFDGWYYTNSFGNTSYYQEGQKVVFTGNVTLLAKWEQVTEAYTVYTVVNGDTLWEIAKRELGDGNRYTDIMILNDLTSTFISPGQKLQIPNKECKVYIVFSGDTLWEISKRELGDGNRYIEIMTLNNLDSTYLLPGQILILPGK